MIMSSERQRLIKRCDALFSLIRRHEESIDGYCRCISCNTIKQIKEMDNGHYIGRGCMFLRYDPRNAWPQCRKCNSFQSGLSIHNYRENLIKKLGLEVVEELETLRHRPFKYSIEELKDLRKQFNKRLKELE